MERTLCFQGGAQICAFSFPHTNLHFHLCEDSNATGGLGGPPGYKVPISPGEGPEIRGELRYAMGGGSEGHTALVEERQKMDRE